MPPLDTELCQLLDIERPIVQAPIESSPELAAAVSNAGGLGMLSLTWEQPEECRELIRDTQAKTDRPFGANIVLDPNSKEIPTEDVLEVALEEDVDVFSFSFGSGTEYIERIHAAGGYVMQTVGSVEGAVEAAETDTDVIVTQGQEAGGHVESEVATLSLVPRVIDAVDDRPVVAAGGIADGRGIAAVLALGAAGAWLGTRFLASKQSTKHPEYKQHVLKADETDTEYTELFDVGWPDVAHRVVRNSTFERWEDAGRPSADDRPGKGEQVAETADGEPIERYHFGSPTKGVTGDIEAMALYAGESAGLIEQLPDASEIVDQLAAETIEAIDDLSSR